MKPANILLDDRGSAYVTDFGLALKDAPASDRCSRAGTPAYMSPEQAPGESHRMDGRADVFSLGVVFYELLTGQKPFTGVGYDQLLEQVLWSEARPPTQLDPTIAEELERICLKSLGKRAADRYQTAGEFADDLEHFVEQFEQFLRDHPEMRSHTHDQLGLSVELPQTGVSWYQAVAYCNWPSRQEGIDPHNWCYEPNAAGLYAAGMKIKRDPRLTGYRLPSEAEWEYACRAGASAARYFGNTEGYLHHYAIFADVSVDDLPSPIGRRKPNDLGMFDMLGNAAEWCQDAYAPDASTIHPRNPVTDDVERVLRGGSFRDGPSHLRSAARSGSPPASEKLSVGFRVARSWAGGWGPVGNE